MQEKETAALKRAKLAETKEKMREEDAKLEEQEKALQVTGPVRPHPCCTPQPGLCVPYAYARRACSARAHGIGLLTLYGRAGGPRAGGHFARAFILPCVLPTRLRMEAEF